MDFFTLVPEECPKIFSCIWNNTFLSLSIHTKAHCFPNGHVRTPTLWPHDFLHPYVGSIFRRNSLSFHFHLCEYKVAKYRPPCIWWLKRSQKRFFGEQCGPWKIFCADTWQGMKALIRLECQVQIGLALTQIMIILILLCDCIMKMDSWVVDADAGSSGSIRTTCH